MSNKRNGKATWFFETAHGKIFHGSSYDLVTTIKDGTVDLIVTSPPFGLIKAKEYGNVPADRYLDNIPITGVTFPIG